MSFTNDPFLDGCREGDFEELEQKVKQLTKENALLRARAEKAEAALPHWIPVEERMPDFGSFSCEVIVRRNDGLVTAGWYGEFDRYWHDGAGGRRINVTHWMPLPAPPAHDAGRE